MILTVTTLYSVELGVLGPLYVRQGGAPVAIPGAKSRAVLTMLGLHDGSVVAADTLVELLWGEEPPRTAAKALQTHISSLRRSLGDGFVLTQGTGWALAESDVDASRYRSSARLARDAAASGDISQAVVHFEEALALWRGAPELPDGRRGVSEKTRWLEGHAALVEDRADALLASGRAAEIVGELEAAVADAPLRERRWGQLMLALYRAGRQGDALAAYQRARALLADELGVDPGPELRRLESTIVAQASSLDVVVAQHLPSVMRAVTFLLTDIEGSTAAWETDAAAMTLALARHDQLAEQVVTSRGGRLIKTRGEGDATFSVFDRPSAAAAAALELQDAITHEPWGLRAPMRIRIALHTGEVELRDGDYFGRAVNRAARLRSLAAGGQILCSGATAELVVDSLPDDVVLADLGLRELRNLARPEHVFELRPETAEEVAAPPTSEPPMQRPAIPAVLIGAGPFVGRGSELERLLSAWQRTLGEGACAALIAGEPGVGKTRLAGEWCKQAYEQGAVVLYGRCDEDLGAPYQPFAEALRSFVPCVGTSRLRGLRGVEALLPLVPGLIDVVPDLAAPTRADPDTERYALFDALVALLETASTQAPVVLVLDDLHWAAKSTLLLLRHLLRFGDRARLQIVGTYRSTDLDRSHPLAAMLADLHRDGTAGRISLGGLDEDDVSAYVAEAGYDDEELGRALAAVTGGNPFFLIEALRHVDESGGVWDPSTLPQGVREAVSRRLSRLPLETNKALAAAAVVGSRFPLDLVERVVSDDLVDAFDEAAKAGILIEEPGGRYRFNHAIVRQSLLAELPSVRRLRLHQRIAVTLEDEPGADDERLAELAHHYFECAWAGNAAKAVEYCRRAADQAMARLAYEGAAELYDHALHALEELDDELPDRDDQNADLLVARCEALLAAGDVGSAASAVSQLQQATVDSARLSAWATCFDGQLSVLSHPERLDDVEAALDAAARRLAEIGDAAGEAKAHTVRATCLARLGRIGDCEIALDDALTAARRAREHRRVNAVLAGAPLAALWGPNPVPRAGGRCLDVVRLLRITTDSPAVEATSTRCQAVLEAFRGRDAAARRMIDSARRTVTELGLRHALLEVEQFAGIVELVLDDPATAEPHLRRACDGFRRMGLDADTAETAALLGRACLALDRDGEADELCTESERLAGHALKPAIAWRTLRAQLLSRGGDHDEARGVAEVAVSLAERTDGLVDHGDACLSLARVLGAAGDAAGAQAAAECAVELYERKGAAALADKARTMLDERVDSPRPAPSEAAVVETRTAAVQASERVWAATDREAWDEFRRLFAPESSIQSRRKVVGFKQSDMPSDEVMRQMRCDVEAGILRVNHVVIAVRGERLALARVELGASDTSLGAPPDEFLQLSGVDEQGRIALQIWFDSDDLDAAIAELDAVRPRFEEEGAPARRLENLASRADGQINELFAERRWDDIDALLADDVRVDDRRRGLHRAGADHATELTNARAIADIGIKTITSRVVAIRGQRLALTRTVFSGRDQRPDAFHTEILRIVEIDADERIVALVAFDPDDLYGALAELDARYLAAEAAPHANTWALIAGSYGAFNRRELPAADWDTVDHRRATPFASSTMTASLRAMWDLTPDLEIHVEAVHRLNASGAVITHTASGSSPEGFDAEWRAIDIVTIEGDRINRCEIYDEGDLDAALERFDELSRPAPRLENAASQMGDRFRAHFAAGDWDAMAETLAADLSNEDRRRVVGTGTFDGRDAQMANARAISELWSDDLTRSVLATRGKSLALARITFSRHDEGADAFHTECLIVNEINADGRISAIIVFDLEDFDLAIAELDARYVSGEAAAYRRTWGAIAGVFVAHNRREVAPITADPVSVDHRRVAAFAPGEGFEYIRAGWDLDQSLNIYIEAVHRANDLGAVLTWAGHGTSHEGFEAEWRAVSLMTIDGEMVSRMEVFDEADLDTALARFEVLGRPAPRLENAANRSATRLLAAYATRDWKAIADTVADDIETDDRRRVANAGFQRGRDAVIENVRLAAELGASHATSTTIAVRGARLVLAVIRYSLCDDDEAEPFGVNLLQVAEIDTTGRISAQVLFDFEDFEAAIAELDARYLAGEAAGHARTWTVIAGSYAAINRSEMPLTTPDCANVDHRREIAMGVGDLVAYISAVPDRDQDSTVYVEAVHRLTERGAAVTYAAHGTSQGGFDAEWRGNAVFTVDGQLVNRTEIFDEADLDAAVMRFDELNRGAAWQENAASRVDRRFQACFAASDWEVMAEMLSDGFAIEDRRRVVNMGSSQGRDAELTVHAYAAAGTQNVISTVVATRSQRLVLNHYRFSGTDQRTDAFRVEMLAIVEIDAAERMAAVVVFDVDDFDAAIAELDARYLAGETVEHARTWTVIAKSFAALGRQELPAISPGSVFVDHRRAAAFGTTDLSTYIRAGWDLGQNIRPYVAAVHRLSDVGVVCSYAAHGVSHEGFDAEWRGIDLTTVDGDVVDRCEFFDEADLGAALSRFEELSRPTRQLENTASRTWERFRARLAAGDWVAMAAMTAEGAISDDRRRVIGAGLHQGREANLAIIRSTFDVGMNNVTTPVVATRGERLVLDIVGFSEQVTTAEPFHSSILRVLEIDAEERLVAAVLFDPGDFEAAFGELDARYLAGEAVAHAHTWSVITRFNDAFNRQEIPPTDWVTVDHRRLVTADTSDLPALIRDVWSVTPDLSIRVEAVHRLSSFGAVVTRELHATSQEGFAAEWRMIHLLAVQGDRISRSELFDEADVDAALARFDELHSQATRLGNAAGLAAGRFFGYLGARNWTAMADILAEQSFSDDRRHVVNAGRWDGSDVVIAKLRETTDYGVLIGISELVATRGQRLVLACARWSANDQGAEAFPSESLCITEVDGDGRIGAFVMFDPDDLGGAIAELDARYLAGEASPFATTWSAVAGFYAALNRHEIRTAPGWVNVDHRRATTVASGDIATSIRATWDLAPNITRSVEAVHRLNQFGTVIAHTAHGTSRDGFDAEWRLVALLTFTGDLVDRCELFDEADLDLALARFDELQPPAKRLENKASQVGEQQLAYFAVRDWAAMSELLADDASTEDRRRVVNAGNQHGRDVDVATMRALADLGVAHIASTVIATRGERLALTRSRMMGHDQRPDAFYTEALTVLEIDAENRSATKVVFDPDDIDAAFAELDARYLAGEAAAYAHTWTAIMQVQAAYNRHDVPPTTADCVNVDYRRGRAFASGDVIAYMRATYDVAPNVTGHLEAVHRLNDLGVVVTEKVTGTSRDGFAFEWREAAIFEFEGDLVCRFELFDEADLDTALARFDELHPPTPRRETRQAN